MSYSRSPSSDAHWQRRIRPGKGTAATLLVRGPSAQSSPLMPSSSIELATISAVDDLAACGSGHPLCRVKP